MEEPNIRMHQNSLSSLSLKRDRQIQKAHEPEREREPFDASTIDGEAGEAPGVENAKPKRKS